MASSAWLDHLASRRAALKCLSASRGLFRYLAAAAEVQQHQWCASRRGCN